MIVRISSEGQYRLSSAHLDTLNELDNQLVEIIAECDEATFRTHLERLLAHVRENGELLPPDSLEESNVILPPPDITLEEARSLFVGEGLVPG
jgi:DNA gyrase inhibitor GyrI